MKREVTNKKIKLTLKRNISLIEALVVSFLITGGLSYSEESVKGVETIKKSSNEVIQSKKNEEIQIAKNSRGFITTKNSTDGKYKSKLEIYGEATEINKEKAIKVSEHILEKRPKYLSAETVSIEEKNKIKKEISEKIKKDKSKEKLEEEVLKYCKENSLLEQKLYNGNGETVREYLKETEVKEFFIIERNTPMAFMSIGALVTTYTGVAIMVNDSLDNRGNRVILEKNSDSAGGAILDETDPDPLDETDLNQNPDEDLINNKYDDAVWIDGIFQNDTKVYTNQIGTTVTTTENNHGMRSAGTDSEITNNGEIILNNLSIITTPASGSKEIINYETGEIQKGSYAGHVFGMVGDYGATVKNTGIISLTKVGQGGIFVTNGSNALNEGNIQGIGSVGMHADGVGSTAINKEIISNTGDYGMSSINGGAVRNEVEGAISNDGNYGIYASGVGSTGINDARIANTGKRGMYAFNKGTVTNEVRGVISNGGSYGMEAEGTGSTGINKGIIYNTGDYGMSSISGGTVTNEVGGTVSNAGNYGIYASGVGSLGINEGRITNNTGTFAIGYGMYASNGGTVTNEVGGTIATIGAIGIYSGGSGSVGINNGTISNDGYVGMGVEGSGSTGINNGIIANTGNRGMYAFNKGALTNEVGGIISNGGSYGMEAEGTGSTGINNGIISNGGDFGMYASNGGAIINKVSGVISQQGGTISMRADGAGSTVENRGIVNGTIDAINGGIAINRGIIDINGVSSIGMEAINGGTVVNEGEINVNVDSGRAMSVSTNSTLINRGDINLNSTNGVGIYVTGTGATVENNGSIYIVGEKASISGIVTTTKDANGNQAIYIGEAATFVNNGQFTVDGDLDSRSMGAGAFVVAGGTVEAKTIRGDYYSSGALAMGSYKDEYTTYQMFKAENMYADIHSNSAMFDAKLKAADSNGFYGVDMYRKDFKDIVTNSEYGAYLENNYIATNDSEAKKDLYDAYKLVVSQDRLNKEIDETFGNTIYPTFMYQTLSMIRTNNQKLKSEVFVPTNEEVRYIGYANYSDSELEMDGNVSDYDANLSSVSLGMDKKMSEAVRVGLVGTLGKGEYNYNGSSDKREDDFYQLNLVGSYEKDDIKGTATAYFGRTSGDIERTLAVTTVYEEMKGDLDNEYYGLDLSLEKKYKLEKFNLIPKIELNTVFVKQDSVDEKGDYALDVESIDSTSVEGGIGFKIDRDFIFGNGVKATPNLTAMYYREFSDPYEDTDATLTSVSPDKVTIDGYNSEKDRGVFGVATTFEKNNLGLTVGVEYKVDDQSSEVTPYAGIGYKF